MKHQLPLILLLIVAAVLTVSLQMCAKNQKFPSGKFVSYFFCRGGGMNPMDYTIYHLYYDEDTGKPLLTVSGECEGEEITVEAGEEVFKHCLELVKKHKLNRSKGYYKSKFEALDAPSSSFSVSFDDPYEAISGSGDMPQFIWDGISEIHKYLMSVVGGRKAEGHVDRLYKIEGFSGMHWTDGVISVTTSGESVDELKQAARRLDIGEDTSIDVMGYGIFRDGEHQYVEINDYRNDRNHLFYSFDGTEVAREQMVKRHLASLLCGSYTDEGGRRFVFTADGMCQGPTDESPKPFIVFHNGKSATPQYLWQGNTISGFCLTADGADILGKQSKVVTHLKRANEGDEIWPVVNKRFLSQAMMDVLSTEQLEQMLSSVYVRRDSPYNSMAWYTDIGGVNRDLLISEIAKRKKE